MAKHYKIEVVVRDRLGWELNTDALADELYEFLKQHELRAAGDVSVYGVTSFE